MVHADFLNNLSSIPDDIHAKIISVLQEDQAAAMEHLTVLLAHDYDDPVLDNCIPVLACRGIALLGELGVSYLGNVAVAGTLGFHQRHAALATLWYASEGRFPPDYATEGIENSPLRGVVTGETQEAAADVIRDVMLEAKVSWKPFNALMAFLFAEGFRRAESQDMYAELASLVFSVFSEASIKITDRVIREFEALLEQDLVEERYQEYLETHPVLLDPLAAEVIDKQQLGVEFVTDFVVRRHDGLYVLVEIERPMKRVFNQQGDFTSHFSHALGQVLDFQQWVDDHSEYARSLMPGLSSPEGLLVVGRSHELSPDVRPKWLRLRRNLTTIQLLTFDDLVKKAQTLLASVHGPATPGT